MENYGCWSEAHGLVESIVNRSQGPSAGRFYDLDCDDAFTIGLRGACAPAESISASVHSWFAEDEPALADFRWTARVGLRKVADLV